MSWPSFATRPARGVTPDEIVTADGLDPVAVTAALAGVEAAVCAVGPVPGGAPGVQGELTEVLLGAAGEAGVRRIVVVTASGWVVDGDDPLTRFVAKPILARFLRDANAGSPARSARSGRPGSTGPSCGRRCSSTAPLGAATGSGGTGTCAGGSRCGAPTWPRAVCDLLVDPTAGRATVSVAS